MAAVDYFGRATVGSISEGMLSSVFAPGAGVGMWTPVADRKEVGHVRLCDQPWGTQWKARQDHLPQDALFYVPSIPVLLLLSCDASMLQREVLSLVMLSPASTAQCWRPFKDTSLQLRIGRCLSSMGHGDLPLKNSWDCWCPNWAKCWAHDFPM